MLPIALDVQHRAKKTPKCRDVYSKLSALANETYLDMSELAETRAKNKIQRPSRRLLPATR